MKIKYYLILVLIVIISFVLYLYIQTNSTTKKLERYIENSEKLYEIEKNKYQEHVVIAGKSLYNSKQLSGSIQKAKKTIDLLNENSKLMKEINENPLKGLFSL